MFKYILKESFDDKEMEMRFRFTQNIKNKKLFRIVTILIIIYYIYTFFNSYLISQFPLDIYSNIVRYAIFTPVIFLFGYLVFFKIEKIHTGIWYNIWMVTLSILSLLVATITTIRTLLCSLEVIQTLCSTIERPGLPYNDFFALLGPLIMLLVFYNSRLYQGVFILIYVIFYIISIGITGQLGSTVFSILILVGGYILSLIISYYNDKRNRDQFLLMIDLQNEIETKEKLANEKEALKIEKEAYIKYILHEVNVPLNIITLSKIDLETFYMQNFKEDDDVYIEFYKIMKDIDVLVNVINTNMYMKYENISVKKNVDMKKLIQYITTSLKTQCEFKGLNSEITLDQIKEISTLYFDEDRFIQTIQNYISNAVKFTDKGTITLKINVTLKTTEYTQIKVQVIDSGVGISEENQKKLFKPYTQIDSNKKGTGLGLSIVANNVTILNGTYGVTSELGKGSIFWFEVLLHNKQNIENENNIALDDSIQYDQLNLNVLIVDDDTLTRQVLVKTFTKLNYTVEEAIDGVDALQKIFDGVDYNDEISISTNRETKYDIIFIDNLMPKLSGTQCIHILRTRGITTPIVSFTGSSFPDERNVIISHGANYVIKKPGYLNDIKKVILALKNDGYFESKLNKNKF